MFPAAAHLVYARVHTGSHQKTARKSSFLICARFSLTCYNTVMSFRKKHPILTHIFLLSIPFALMHILALYFSLYWTTNWYDIIMHFFGGFLASLIVVYSLYKIGISPQTISHKFFFFLFVITAVFAVAVVWELWEIFAGMTDPFTDLFDTIKDIIMGMIGGMVGYIYYDKKLKSK